MAQAIVHVRYLAEPLIEADHGQAKSEVSSSKALQQVTNHCVAPSTLMEGDHELVENLGVQLSIIIV